MEIRHWKETLEFVGVIAIVASLIFVGLQLQQDQKIAVGASLTSIVASTSDLQMQSAAYATVLAKAAKNEQLNDAEIIVLRHLVEIQEVSAFVNSIALRTFSNQGISTAELLFVSFLFRHPAAREQWENHVADIKRYVDPLRTPNDLESNYKTGSGAYRARIRDKLAQLDELYQ